MLLLAKFGVPQFHRLYHYTTDEGYYAITAEPDGMIKRLIHWVHGRPDPNPLRPSMGEGGKDAFHGAGWYMTDIEPGSMSRRDIAIRLWDGGGFSQSVQDRTECWLAYDIHHRAVVSCRKHVFLVRATSRAQLRLVSHGWTPAS